MQPWAVSGIPLTKTFASSARRLLEMVGMVAWVLPTAGYDEHPLAA
jgi:hypothetical protein